MLTSEAAHWQTLIDAAAQRVAPFVRRTPILTLKLPGLVAGVGLTLKLEQLQHSGSFKARGAFNHLLSRQVPSSGVVAASGGNHGAAVAYAARCLNHRADIFVPTIAAATKVARLNAYGANVHIVGENYASTLAASAEHQAATGALTVHAYDQNETVLGQGTIARELQQQAPDLDTVLVAVGGGGLLGGISAWYQDQLKLVSVETNGTATLHSAHHHGAPVDIDVTGIAADALGARRIGDIAFAVTERYLDERLVVSDEAVRAAQHWLWDELRVVAEPAGATALAAVLTGAYRAREGEQIGVIICGANTDPASLSSAESKAE